MENGNPSPIKAEPLFPWPDSLSVLRTVLLRLEAQEAESLEMEEWDTESGNDPLVGEEQAIAAIPGLEQVTLQVVQKTIYGHDLLQMLVQEKRYAADRLMDRLSPEQKQQLQRMVADATSTEKERIKAE